MIKFEFLPAGSGDCIFIDINSEEYILIDGGFVKTYNRSLKEKIKKLNDESKFLDLIVVTHIDNDHINGIKKLFGSKYKSIVKNVWFNSGTILKNHFDSDLLMSKLEIEEPQNDSEEIGYIQGIQLEDLLDKLCISNKVPVKAMNEISFTNINFKILSPDIDKLSNLSEKWNEELAKLKLSNSDEISAQGNNDYDKTIEELISNNFESDTSITNGSSIAFILQYQKMQFLLLGDAFVDVIVNSLKAFKYSKEKLLRVEFVKLSHHGSKKNINESLLELIDTDTYIISTDGKSHEHPDQEALSRIIMFNKDKTKQTKFYFNYEKEEYFPNIFKQYEDDFIKTNDKIYDIYTNKQYNFSLYFPKENGIYLEFQG